jgi:hypothetical protein
MLERIYNREIITERPDPKNPRGAVIVDNNRCPLECPFRDATPRGSEILQMKPTGFVKLTQLLLVLVEKFIPTRERCQVNTYAGKYPRCALLRTATNMNNEGPRPQDPEIGCPSGISVQIEKDHTNIMASDGIIIDSIPRCFD